MSPRVSKGWVWLLLPLAAVAFFLGATLFYRGSYSPPPEARAPAARITLPAQAASRIADAPVARQGVLLVDNLHGNAFSEQELNTLISRVSARGYTVQFVLRRDVPFTSGNRIPILEEALPRADSFAVIQPQIPYISGEVDVVERFLDKGGRLLLIADPGRRHRANSLAERFGVLFEAGYLYNVVEHDLNYRNIFVRDLRAD